MLHLWMPGIVTDGSNIGKDDYVHPTVEAVKELEKSLSQLRLEDGKFINWEMKQTGLDLSLLYQVT